VCRRVAAGRSLGGVLFGVVVEAGPLAILFLIENEALGTGEALFDGVGIAERLEDSTKTETERTSRTIMSDSHGEAFDAIV